MAGQILVIGSSGLVGSRFVELFPHPELLLTPSESEFNFLRPASITSYLAARPVSSVLNFAAFTDVAAAEAERGDTAGLCWQVNVSGVHLLRSLIAPSALLIQISTDMVFSGSSSDPGPYPEDHAPEPDPSRVTWYGFSKSQAELAAGPGAAVVRISSPVRARYPAKLDYFRKPLALFDGGQLYPLFTDQRLTISFIDEVTLALQAIINDHRSGIFHVSSSDVTTPYEVISYLLSSARHQSGVVKPASLASQPSSVRYPRFGGLKCALTQAALGQSFSSTKVIIAKLISQGLT